MDNKIFSVKHTEIPQVFSSVNNQWYFFFLQSLICNKGFAYTSSLIKHMRIHTGEKPYCCRKGCDQKFSQISNLIRHERIHSGDKPYVCEVCGKSFTSSSNLKQHLNIHQNNVVRKKFVCFIDSCDKGYLYICTLKKHVKKTHPEEFNTIILHYRKDNFFDIFKHLMGNPKTFGFLNFKIDDKFELDNNEGLSKPRLVRRKHKLQDLKHQKIEANHYISTTNSPPLQNGFFPDLGFNGENKYSAQKQGFSFPLMKNEQKLNEANAALGQFFGNYNNNIFFNLSQPQILENLSSSIHSANNNLYQILSLINSGNVLSPNHNIFEFIKLFNFFGYQTTNKACSINDNLNFLSNINCPPSILSPELLIKSSSIEDEKIIDTKCVKEQDLNKKQDSNLSFFQGLSNYSSQKKITSTTSFETHTQGLKTNFLDYNNKVEEILQNSENQVDLRTSYSKEEQIAAYNNNNNCN